MEQDVFIPLMKNKEDLTTTIMSILNREGALSTKSIHGQVKKNGIGVTYQAVHKMLNKMVENKVLNKKNKLYVINLNWVIELEKFARDMKRVCLTRAPLQLEGLNKFNEKDNVKVFEFNSLGNAERFRKQLQIAYLENYSDPRPYASQTHHMKSPIGFSEKSLKIVEAIEKYQKHCYMLVASNSPIDNWCANYYKRDLINIKMGVATKRKFDIIVLGDEIVTIHTPSIIIRTIDKMYKEKEIKNLNMLKFYREVYEKKVPTKVQIIKNHLMAEQIRKTIIQCFKKNLRKEIAQEIIDIELVNMINLQSSSNIHQSNSIN